MGLGSSRAFVVPVWVTYAVLGPEHRHKPRLKGPLTSVWLRVCPSPVSSPSFGGSSSLCCVVGGDGEGSNMSKKNNLAKRKKQYEFDLQRTIPSSPASFPLLVQFQSSPWGVFVVSFGGRILAGCAGEKEAKEKQAKKLQAKKSKMKVPPTLQCSRSLFLYSCCIGRSVNTERDYSLTLLDASLCVLWHLDFLSFAL
jgi:hypothetical protein